MHVTYTTKKTLTSYFIFPSHHIAKCYYKFKELEDENCYIVINSFKWTFEGKQTLGGLDRTHRVCQISVLKAAHTCLSSLYHSTAILFFFFLKYSPVLCRAKKTEDPT